MNLDDIVLHSDRRGISMLRPSMEPDFTERAASFVLERSGTAIIVTGFYILSGGAPETDGPLGAVVIGDALKSLGYDVVYASDQYTVPLLLSLRGASSRIVSFPITDSVGSESFAKDILEDIDPVVIISIERCGATEDGYYRNMHGEDLGHFNAKIDPLFSNHSRTVAIGDGGNEIGMGNLASHITSVPTLVKSPCVTQVNKLIITSVSNWGGYGLVAAISKLKGKNLLPSVEEEQELLMQTVEIGAVDGMSGKFENKVDGFTMEENSETIRMLHEYLERAGISL